MNGEFKHYSAMKLNTSGAAVLTFSMIIVGLSLGAIICSKGK